MYWGSGLEDLADGLLARLAEGVVEDPAAVFARRDCIVAPTRVQQAWLRQRFLYDLPLRGAPPHTLMNCDFPLLPVFLEQWISRYAPGASTAGEAAAELAPFAVKNLRWRIFSLLMRGGLPESFAPIRHYTGGRPDALRAFKLAGRLARMLDEYQTYRPQMMQGWAEGNHPGLDNRLAWEPDLWRMLLQEVPWADSRPAAFLRMQEEPAACGIQEVYRRVYVFSPAMLPGAHLAFFQAIGRVLPVAFYLFNPARGDWFDYPSAAQIQLERPADDGEALEVRHPLLSAFARGSRDTVAAATDLSGGQYVPEDESAAFPLPEGNSCLYALQRSVIENKIPEGARLPADGSVQFHLCHSKLREVQVVRDLLLRAFAEDATLEPRHIQVQMPDISVYAPYIEAVFGDAAPDAPERMPFVLADRSAAGESPAATAWRMLLELGEGRFTAPEITALLRCAPIAARFGFTEEDVDHLIQWVTDAGIRWGRDQRHRTDLVKGTFTAQTTWRRGLDRLLLGYALGAEPHAIGPDHILPCNRVGESDALLLGRFVRFYDLLTDFCAFAGASHTAAEWAEALEALLAACLHTGNDNYRETGMLRRAIALFRTTAEAAQSREPLPLSVVRRFFADHLQEVSGARGLLGNAVVFSNLRPGSSAPRRVMVLMGMGEAEFPRVEQRAAYDLLRGSRRMGDRSAGIEDRMAFLEALMHTRGSLFFTRVAFAAEDAAALNESVLLTELKETLAQLGGNPAEMEIRHRLHAFAPDYFSGGKNAPLFSYSLPDFQIAQARAAGAPPEECAPLDAPEGAVEIPLSRLIAFFKNPAKYFHRHVLGVYLAPEEAVDGQESEAFELDGLTEYQIRQAFLEEIRAAGAFQPEAVRARMTENGGLPLGEYGAARFAAACQAFEDALQQPAAPFGTVAQALQSQRGQTETPVEVALENVRLAGALSTGAENRQVFASAGGEKPKHVLAPWMQHVFANALAPVQTLVVFAKDGRSRLLPPLDAEKAKSLLVGWVQLYAEGLTQPLPFAPATSYAKISAPEKAAAEWAGGYMKTGEGEDMDFAKAFGEAGPMAQEAEFTRAANAVWADFVEIAAKKKATP